MKLFKAVADRGSTLIEATIILLVLLILGAILMPSISNFTDMAKSVRDRHNSQLRSISPASIDYQSKMNTAASAVQAESALGSTSPLLVNRAQSLLAQEDAYRNKAEQFTAQKLNRDKQKKNLKKNAHLPYQHLENPR
jgi:Tfp pilus assembly protein PilE